MLRLFRVWALQLAAVSRYLDQFCGACPPRLSLTSRGHANTPLLSVLSIPSACPGLTSAFGGLTARPRLLPTTCFFGRCTPDGMPRWLPRTFQQDPHATLRKGPHAAPSGTGKQTATIMAGIVSGRGGRRACRRQQTWQYQIFEPFLHCCRFTACRQVVL